MVIIENKMAIKEDVRSRTFSRAGSASYTLGATKITRTAPRPVVTYLSPPTFIFLRPSSLSVFVGGIFLYRFLRPKSSEKKKKKKKKGGYIGPSRRERDPKQLHQAAAAKKVCARFTRPT